MNSRNETAWRVRSVALCILLQLASSVYGADIPSRAEKLKAMPVFPALADAAQLDHISTSGIDPFTTATNELGVGDSATILVTFVHKEKKTQWLIEVEAAVSTNKVPPKVSWFQVNSSFGPPEKFESKPAPATVRMLGPFTAASAKESKPPEKKVNISLNEGFLKLGFEKAAETMWHWNQTNKSADFSTSKAMLAMKPTPAEKRAICGTFPALFSYFNIVEHTEGLKDLLFKLVRLPSVWSMIKDAGVDVDITFAPGVAPADLPDWNLPASTPLYYFPFTLELNDQPGMKVTLIVARPQSPLLITGGVAGILIERIGDEKMYMTMRMISAHRSSEAKK
jgi:hypothetical protein